MFINRKQRVPIGKWVKAECHPTKGYAVRKGWHCCPEPKAPHLSEKGRVWTECLVEEVREFDRSQHQGGKWILAQKIKVLREVGSHDC